MLIGIMGRKTSGKDTAADVLVKEYGFTKFSMAGPLKEAYYALDPIVEVSRMDDRVFVLYAQEAIKAWGWDEAKERFPEIRRGLQRLGKEVCRDIFGQGFWVALMEKNLQAVLKWHNFWPSQGRVVIPDIRFPNEITLVRKWGGVLWRVDRPTLPPEDPSDPLMQHESEKAWRTTAPDCVLSNCGDIEMFQQLEVPLWYQFSLDLLHKRAAQAV